MPVNENVEKGVAKATFAVGYIRVSTAEQADSGAGLAAQRLAIEQAVQYRGWQLGHVYEDAGATGKNLKRPGLTEALAAVETGGADVLLVSKLDRLSRSLVDFAGLLERSRQRGWTLVALDLGVDTASPAGEFLANVLASAAQWERRVIGQRTRDALAIKKAQGVRLGRPPSVAPETVARIRRLRADGATYQAIADALNNDAVPTGHGGRHWYPNSARQVQLSAAP